MKIHALSFYFCENESISKFVTGWKLTEKILWDVLEEIR